MNNHPKVLVLGLDGGTWNVIKPLVEQGKLPTIAKLMRNGCYGDLESCIPPITFPAWKCYSTGKNPGKLGVFWWTQPDFKNRKIKTNNSTSFKSKEIWDFLDEFGIPSGVIGMPTTYPPKKLRHGFVVSEMNPTDTGFTYPTEIEKLLKDEIGYRGIFTDYHGKDAEIVLNDRINLIQQRFNAAKLLLNYYPTAFLNLTIFYIDNIQHFYWGHMAAGDAKYGNAIEKTWRIVDRGISEIVYYFNPEYIFIISDHGFTSLRAVFNICKWAMNKGYLCLNSKAKFLSRFGILFTVGSVVYTLVSKVRKSKELLTTAVEGIIDWNKSKILPYGEGVVYLNPHAFSSEEDKDAFREVLIEELRRIREPKTGEPLAKKVFRKEEIYKGKYIDQAPDILILPNEGYEITCSFRFGGEWNYSIKESGWSGTHALHGIFIAYGPDVKKGCEVEGVRIYDIAPTILHLYGLPIPRDMDGRVLEEIFEEGSEMARRPIMYRDVESEKSKIREKIMLLKKEGRI